MNSAKVVVFPLMILLLFCNFQNQNPSDKTESNVSSSTLKEVEKLREKIEELLEDNKHGAALSLYFSLQEQYRNSRNWEAYVETYYERADLYRRTYQFQQVENCLDSAKIPILQYQINTQTDDFAFLWSDYGNYYLSIQDYSKANQYFNKVLEIDLFLLEKSKLESGEIDSVYLDYLGYDYQNLAVVFGEIGDYSKAIQYYQQSISYFFEDNKEKATLFHNMASDYHSKGALELANEYYSKAIFILEHLPNQDELREQKIGHYQDYAAYFNRISKYDNTAHYLQKAELLLLPYEKEFLSDQLTIGGGYHIGKKQFSAAKEKWLKALNLRLQLSNPSRTAIADSYQIIGQYIYAQQDSFQTALEYYQKGIAELVPDFNDTLQIESNPTLNRNISDRLRLLNLLALKADALQKVEQNNHAKSTFNIALQLIDKIRFDYLADGSKYVLLEKAMPIYEQAIDLALKMNEKEWAFELAERGKATLMLESIKNSEAQEFAGIDPNLLKKEKALKVEIAFYERLLNEVREEEQKKEYQHTLFDLRVRYQDFLEQLEKDYPDYYTLKYDLKYPSVAEVQRKLLNSKTSLLEYFTGDSTIYLFLLTKDDIQVHQFPRTTDLETTIQQFRRAITTPDMSKENFWHFTQSAYSIYENYMQPALENLPPEIDNLLIIPDGQLNYIPFQALLNKPFPIFEDTESRYDLLPYLLKDYTISYAYSSTLLLELSASIAKRKMNFGAFAPVFSGGKAFALRNDTLNELIHSKREVEQIQSILNGKYFLNDTASLLNFRDHAKEFTILHLSTHAAVDDQNPSQSRIHFYNDYLTLREIYNLQIEADLTVLSACETSVGEFQRGEGILSLARAFMYAGCPSLVTSLWQVNDEKTADLMIEFYQQLSEGHSKSEALQLAQMEYLNSETSFETKHPFYWAAFVQTGNTAALTQKNRTWIWVIGLGFLLLIFILVRSRTT